MNQMTSWRHNQVVNTDTVGSHPESGGVVTTFLSG